MDAVFDRLVTYTATGIGEIALRLVMAAVLTMVVGWERERRDKPAGLRTHMLVGVGAAAFYIVAYEILVRGFTGESTIRIDPTRIVEGLIGGIGFLGAGAILQSKGDVRGLTTAAGIWVAGAIGLAAGAGFYTIAAVVAAFVFVILRIVGWLEHRWVNSRGD
jgi:putative Mg2+ transporter-C (MgtC) family protein